MGKTRSMPSLASTTARSGSTTVTIYRMSSPRPFRRRPTRSRSPSRTTSRRRIAGSVRRRCVSTCRTSYRATGSTLRSTGVRWRARRAGAYGRKGRDAYPHTNQRNHWLEFDLVDIVPHKGENVLEVSLESRPEGLTGSVTIAEVEVEVRHNPYPAGLK